MMKVTQELLNERFSNFDFSNYQNHEFEYVVDSHFNPETLHVSIICKKCDMGVMRSFTSSRRAEEMTEKDYDYRSRTIFRVMMNDWLSKLGESCNEMIVKQVQNS